MIAMNADHHIGFENDQPVLTVGFDYGSLDAAPTEAPTEAVGNHTRAQFVREFAAAQVNLLVWLNERVPHCSLSAERQMRLKVCVMLLHIRPAELELGRRPTLTKLANAVGVTKQKLGQLNGDFRDRFGVRFSAMKSVATRGKLAARFAKHPKKAALKPSTLSVKKAVPFCMALQKSSVRNEQLFLF